MADPAENRQESVAEARLVLESGSPEDTFEIGRRLGSLMTRSDAPSPQSEAKRNPRERSVTVALIGDLGAGKTTFTKGLVCGAGCPDHRYVHSPTYVLEQIYQGARPIHHYDAYRLADAEELVALGFDERLEERAILVIEWADRVISLLPEDRLVVRIDYGAAPPETPGGTSEKSASSADTPSPEGFSQRRIELIGTAARWTDTFRRLQA